MNDTRSAQLVFHFSIRNFRFPTKLLYVLLRTLPDPFGIPGTPGPSAFSFATVFRGSTLQFCNPRTMREFQALQVAG